MDRAVTPLAKFEKPELNTNGQRLADAMLGPLGLDEANTQYDLPPFYDENRIVAMARDPFCIYFYWELTEETYNMVKDFLDREGSEIQYVARIYEISDKEGGWNNYKTIKLAPFSGNWYVHKVNPTGNYIIDVGFQQEESFITLLRSDPIHTPPDRAFSDPIPNCQNEPKINTKRTVTPDKQDNPSSISVYQK